MAQLLIYTHQITERLVYALDVVCKDVLGIDYEITTHADEFNASQLPKFSYANEKESADVFIKSHTLLFETDVKEFIPVADGTYLDFPVFFKTNEQSFLPFDLFATVFYFVSRYEEYQHSEPDMHGRFKAEHSIAYRHHILQKPFLNYLVADFFNKLKERFPQLTAVKRTFNLLSTIDVDNAFAYAHKGFKRNAGALVKETLSLKWKSAGLRIKSNINDAKDPYNTFKLIHSLSKQSNTALRYFVLIGDYARYDKNPHYLNPGFKKLLKDLSLHYPVGLHPSYQSHDEPQRIALEKKRLEGNIEKQVTAARCHFLRIKFPETYRQFIAAGITDDYTMIYASQCGFRTGLCVPFKWFDLLKNQSTQLIIHPSTVMEGVLRDYNKLKPEQATLKIKELMMEVKKFGGEFVSVWHNDSFTPEQKEWVEVYEKMLREVTEETEGR